MDIKHFENIDASGRRTLCNDRDPKIDGSNPIDKRDQELTTVHCPPGEYCSETCQKAIKQAEEDFHCYFYKGSLYNGFKNAWDSACPTKN